MTTRPDFPFYNGQPVTISPTGWLMVVLSVIAAFLCLILLPFPSSPWNAIPPILFTGLPLLTLAAVSSGQQWALFRRVGIKEILLMPAFAAASFLTSVVMALLLVRLFPMTANPAVGEVAALDAAGVVWFLFRTAVQLVGEELMTILPLLAVLWLCVTRLGMSRRLGLVIAVIVSTLWFSAVHLPTYNWNFVQCFGIIGSARLVLTAAFLLTRNLWVSAGAHIVNDWTEFFLPALFDALGSHTPIESGV